jgi:hypothetical protein
MIISRTKQSTRVDKWWLGDRDWFAVDQENHLAAFVIACEGDVPERLLPHHTKLDECFERILALPPVGGHELLHAYPKADSFIDFAKRGIFAYDWLDVHLEPAMRKQRYQLIARPLCPIKLLALPADLKECFALARFEGVRFALSSAVNVREAFSHVSSA